MSESCVLAGCPSKHTEVNYVGTGFQTTCPTCGTFVISRTLAVSPDSRRDPRIVEGLRAHIQAENAAGKEPILRSTNWYQPAEPYRPSDFSKLFQM
jgi:predicted RNA-binding Zn-ribbon protein involved in translation (DUF1610 family)